jgi:hypothetical protein
MTAFPVLKTGAVAQYPLQGSIRFRTEAVRFLDGSQQKYRIYGGGLRRWSVKLALLDDQELATLIAFADQQGSAPFAFTDPATGQSVSRCVIGADRFQARARGEMQSDAEIAIEEIA